MPTAGTCLPILHIYQAQRSLWCKASARHAEASRHAPFDERLTAPANATGMQEQSVAFDSQTCTMRMERAPLYGGLRPNGQSGTSSGFAYADEIDVINQPVTQDKALMTWSWNFTGCASVLSSADVWHNSPTGWINTGAGHTAVGQCLSAYNSANAHFYNPIFCSFIRPGTVIFSDYNDIRVVGDKYGNIGAGFNYTLTDNVGGECTGLLHTSTKFGYGNGP